MAVYCAVKERNNKGIVQLDKGGNCKVLTDGVLEFCAGCLASDKGLDGCKVLRGAPAKLLRQRRLDLGRRRQRHRTVYRCLCRVIYMYY